jgi:hypothetical protein
LEPDFSTFYQIVRDYNRGWPRCNAGDDDPWFHRFPLITYLRNATPNTQFTDDLHMEVLQNDMQWEQYELRCHVSIQPKVQELNKFGLDEKRDLLAYPCLPILEDLGLAVQGAGELYVGPTKIVPDQLDFNNGPIRFLTAPGDRLWFANHQYEVLSVHEWNYLGNTNVPMYVVLTCNLFRPNTPSVEAGEIV